MRNRSHGRKHGRMHLRTVDASASTEAEHEELASARFCALVDRAYTRRLVERGLIAQPENETFGEWDAAADETEDEDES